MGWGLGGGRGHERGPGDPLASDVSRIDPWTGTPPVTLTRCLQAAAARARAHGLCSASQTGWAGQRPSHTLTANRAPVWGPRASPRGQRPSLGTVR